MAKGIPYKFRPLVLERNIGVITAELYIRRLLVDIRNNVVSIQHIVQIHSITNDINKMVAFCKLYMGHGKQKGFLG